MGSNLRRQLREALPPTIKGLQRAVALEIADDARYDDAWNYSPETGRRSRVRLADLVRWTAAKDELSIREMLRRLSLAGWEFRIPIGKDKNGNLLYAVPGKAMTFRVPDFEGPTTVGPEVEIEAEGPTTVGPETSEGPTGVEQGPTTVEVGPTTVGAGPTTVGPGPTTVGPPSLVSSFSAKESPSSSPVAEDSAEPDRNSGPVTDGGGGGEIDSSEDQEQDKPIARAESFVDSLDYRGKILGQQRRAKLSVRVVAAFKDGWTERGLRRYLDISDDPNIRDAAAVYAHRLSEKELPQAEPEPVVTSDAERLPPVCDTCVRGNPAARYNIRFRAIPGTSQPCPDCHPTPGGLVSDLVSQQQQETDAWTVRAMARAQQRMATGNWAGASTDERVAGWAALAARLEAEERPSTTDQRVRQAIEAGKRVQRQQPQLGRRYSNDVWHQPADPAEAAKIPHCGEPNCDPITRLKTEPDWTGEPHTSMCNCHPSMKF